AAIGWQAADGVGVVFRQGNACLDVTPRKEQTLFAAGCHFPFRFGGQPLVLPFAVVVGVVPGEAAHGMVFLTGGNPAIGPAAGRFSFVIGDEGGVLTVGGFKAV